MHERMLSVMSEEFITRLKLAIDESHYKNMSQLARRMDIDRRTLDKWVTGQSCPSAKHIFVFCSLLCVSADWLLFGIGKKAMKKREREREAVT